MKSSKLFVRKTRRLCERALTTSDYRAWKTAYTSMQPQKNKWDRSTNRSSYELTLASFKNVLKAEKLKRKTEELCEYGVFLKSTGQLIGRISLLSFVRSVHQKAFLSYTLFNPFWGQGYAEEAVRAVVDIAFRDHNLHRVVAEIETDNKKSIQRAGLMEPQ